MSRLPSAASVLFHKLLATIAAATREPAATRLNVSVEMSKLLPCLIRSARFGRTGASPMTGSLHLAQAQSNRARGGRKSDFVDAERLVRRNVAQELVLSFVPSAERRLWRTVTRQKQQRVGARVRLRNQMEAFLEEAHIKLSSLVSDLLGQSGRRMLEALGEGKTDPQEIALQADRRLRATQAQLCDALSAARELNPVYRKLLKQSLEELQLLDRQIQELDREIARLLAQHEDAVQRLAEVPGLGPDSAQQIIAEVSPAAAVFPTAKNLTSWVGVCPGDDISAGESRSTKSPKGNRNVRRILNQAAHAAVKAKGSIFEVMFQRLRRISATRKPSGQSPIASAG